MVIAIAQLMVVLDNTILNIALVPAQADLGFGDSERQWVITAYALAFGSLLLLGGRLSDVIGRKRSFLIGLAGFAVASIVGGAAGGLGMLVTARAVQGAFGALLAPAALALLTMTFPDGRGRAIALGVFSAVVGSGATAGLLLGGALTEYVDWRWCMYVNAVLAVGAIVGAAFLLPAPGRHPRPSVDVPGAVAVTSGLFGLVFGFGAAGTAGWSSPQVAASLAGGVVLLVGFVVLQRRVRTPLLPLRVVLDRDRGGAFLALFVVASGTFATSLFVTYFLQRTLGFSAVLTGVAFLPMVAVIVCASTTMPSILLPRLGPRPLIAAGLVLGALAMYWLSRLETESSYAVGVLGPLILMGLAVGTTNSASVNTATRGVDPGDAGVGSALVNTLPQVGGAMATALLSTVAGTVTVSALAELGTDTGRQAIAAVAGYEAAFLTASIVFMVGAVICGSLIRPGRPRVDRRISATATGTDLMGSD